MIQSHLEHRFDHRFVSFVQKALLDKSSFQICLLFVECTSFRNEKNEGKDRERGKKPTTIEMVPAYLNFMNVRFMAVQFL